MSKLDPDYVIVFSLHSTHPKSTKPPPAESASLQDEYSNLLGLLKDAGLTAVGRIGSRIKGSETLLVLVKATEERLTKEVYRENMSDWLHGVASTSTESPTSPDHFAASSAKPVTAATRLRLVYSILSSPRSGLSSTLLSSSSAGPTCGLSLPSTQFPHILSIFPPHDPAYNAALLQSWSIPSIQTLFAPSKSLDSLRDQFGEHHALYFAFLQHYFLLLSYPALSGTLFWLLKKPFHPLYSISLLIWSIIFLQCWRIKEQQLAVRWASYGVENVEEERKDFVGTSWETDKVTGVEKQVFPWWRILARQLCTIPVLLLYASVLVAVISTIYSVETIVGEVYKGPGKKYLSLLPTVLFAGIVPQITHLWANTASILTTWENHPHQTEHNRSLSRKVFALNFFVAYGSLILTSYVYIPFATLLIPHILSFLPSHPSAKEMQKSSTSFSINSSKLHTQIVAYTLTNQIVGAFTELGVPFLLRFFSKEVEKRLHADELKEGGEEGDEKEYLTRIRNEAELPEYDVFVDYAEMAGQLGYLVLFSVIWPIGPLWSFLNNFFELRGDAFKLMHQSRRPIPRRQTTIGSWLEVLSFITWFGVLTNASLIHLYRPIVNPSTSITNLASSLAGLVTNTTCPTDTMTTAMNIASHERNAQSAIGGTLKEALLIALLASQSYFVVKTCITYLLNKFLWEGSPEEISIQRGIWEMRKGWLGKEGLKMGPSEMVSKSEKVEEEFVVERKSKGGVTKAFWERGDKGVEEMGRVLKVD